MSVDDVVGKICEHTDGMEEDKVRKMIEEKVIELSGLVSREGAAYIVARELGLSLLKESKRQLKIKNLMSGLRSVDIVARVMKSYEPREFQKNGKTGRVANLLLGDETGTVRLSLWNDEVDLIEKDSIKEGDVVSISGGYVKMDNRDMPELRLGRGSMDKTDLVVNVPEQKVIERRFEDVKRKQISDFREGDFGETMACLVQVFRKSPLFEICPQCDTRIREKDGKWVCDDHGQVEPKYAMILSGVIDDGSGNIRAVFFRENAEKIVGRKPEELNETVKDKGIDAVFDDFEGLGKEYVLRGRVKRNQFTDSAEFIVNEIDDVDVKKECQTLLSGK